MVYRMLTGHRGRSGGSPGGRSGRNLACSLGDRVDDVVHDAVDQIAVIALRHHADHRLGAGGADDQATDGAEPLLAGLDRLDDDAFRSGLPAL